jgi:hypothetical protein
MMRYITELRVTKNDKGNNVWKITRCDGDKTVVGQITACGVPERACNLPVGSEFRTVFTIPNPREK